MPDYTVLELLLFQAFLIFLNAVFACAEIAVISANDNKLKLMAESGKYRITLADAPTVDVSSTEIREGLASGEDMNDVML